ncbi:malate dehydrogenase (NAD) [Leadbetterella byssophila DSM 17132]|uniref:Malate dehydrogenase (NAD) n=1 Tax=Leadbetterella byssophila (strain DSM 17132 / JCM 16389 / KACC 11308 / NBRC 106382 / 4M15) TaxID=649349 RepID=E4RY73_LEAB4|nr:malate dehydrogenase [Leadbetterella byssophila]ADQ17284.1 malate dehydrogenase (NAD) [Leadbetterella byssophila DSM 17132]
MKVTIIGAGAVGATAADNIARKEIASEVVILDIKEGFAEGKAMDLAQTASIEGFDTKITGVTNDYSKTAKSDVIVVTSGIPRKPGMTREELIGTNAKIVGGVVKSALEVSPKAVIVIVSNPMDTMTYLTYKIAAEMGISKRKVIGMGGALDSARFRYRLGEALGVAQSDLHGMVIGGHGDTTMIPLTRLATWNSIPVSRFLSAEALKEVSDKTMVGGATLTGLLGTSAWYAPGAAIGQVVESILRDEKKIIPSCVYLNGEYGQKDICLGVPVVIGRNGWEKIVTLRLSNEEKAAFEKSADAVRAMNAAL